MINERAGVAKGFWWFAEQLEGRRGERKVDVRYKEVDVEDHNCIFICIKCPPRFMNLKQHTFWRYN